MSSEEVLDISNTSAIPQEDEEQIIKTEEQSETQPETQPVNESVPEPTPQSEEQPETQPKKQPTNEPVSEPTHQSQANTTEPAIESSPESSEEITSYPIINIINSINIEKSPISINDLKLTLNQNIVNFNSKNTNKINSSNLNNYLNSELIPSLLHKLSLKSSKFKYLINITSITNTDTENENDNISLLNIQGNYWDDDTDGSIVTDIKINDNLQLKLNLTFIYI
ncbi:hypothetical protein BVG19_g5499 [[Candida] boidinii]|nr:hypothetical protein BVG19_g5499 [[Candida] boidinii]OWB49991.1 hypothetical protein B5S27_g1537 [[Candida] boidinii]